MNNYYYAIPRFIQSLFFVFYLPIYKFFVHLEIEGKENMKDLEGPIIIASNHTSELDPTVIPLITNFYSKQLPIYSVIYPIEKYEDSSFGWRRFVYKEWFFKLLGGYPTFSGFKDYETSLEHHINLLNLCRTVCIFPEGKCTTDGKLSPARGGLGFLAYETEAVIVPIVINTFYNIKFLEFILRKRKVTIKILKPIKYSEMIFSEEPEVEDFKHASQIILDKIGEVLSNSV